MYRSVITGTGSNTPEKVLSNKELEKLVDTSDEWIATRSGIKERRIASNGECSSTFAHQACLNALQMAQVSIEKIDTSKIISKTNVSYGLEVPLNSNEVKELYLKWKGKLIKQDTALFDDLFNVTFKEELYSSVNNNKFSYYFKNGIYYIKQQCGDGAGFYEITWIIKNGKIIQRLIDEI